MYRAYVVAAFLLAGGLLASGQQLPSEPARGFGTSITGAYDGWFEHPDGGYAFLVGYLNRNRDREVDVPIGPNNHIEPGGPDLGQPTHFLPGRHVGMFIVRVPSTFTREQSLIWTITVNGVTNSIPLRLNIDYNVSPLRIEHDTEGQGNTPPMLRFAESGPVLQGPLGTVANPALTLTTSVSKPLPLNYWVEDDAKYSSGTNAPLTRESLPAQVDWSKYRGPGKVTFERGKPPIETLAGGKVDQPFKGKGTTTARFSEPGEYILRVVGNDYSGDGGGGEVCCWTYAMVKVTVTP